MKAPASRVAEVELVKGLGLLDATMLIMGSMIGGGIFIVSADIARAVQSPGLLLLIWVVSGFMTILGALSYGELSAAMPQAGGQYLFLKEAYGPVWGFLYGWTLFLVIQTGTIAAVAVAFARYLDVFVPLSRVLVQTDLLGKTFAIDLKQVVGVAVILLLSFLNCFGIRVGAHVQNLFTFLKVLALMVLIVLGLTFVGGSYSHFSPLWPDTKSFADVIGQFHQTFSPLFLFNSQLGSSDGCSHDRRTVFFGCLEQRHFHSWRGQKSSENLTALALPRHLSSGSAFFADQCCLPACFAHRSDCCHR
ncbi:MAG: hypothetical protein DMG06_22740 [Acidobacteria bacterium]|nr:MAG: hypothetical protein DMG06_22740 [Acidobacteriota bacterium]